MAATEPDLLDPVIDGWSEGIARVRNQATWVMSILTAASAALLGTSPLIALNGLTWAADRGKILAAAGLALTAVAATAVFLLAVGRVFRPAVVELHALPVRTRKRLADASAAQGPWVTSAEPAQQLAFANEVVTMTAQLAATEADEARRSTLHAAVLGARSYRTTVAAHAAGALDIARYDTVAQKRAIPAYAVASGALALLSGIALHAVLQIDFGRAALPASTLATLAPADAGHPPPAWTALKLAGCRPPGDGSFVFVRVLRGSGTTDDPYVVSTLPVTAADAKTCTAIEFVANGFEVAPAR